MATPAGAGATGAWERGAAPRLINRLRPAPLESLGSLLERLRVANHYRERGWLGCLLRRHPERPEVLRWVEDFQTLGELTGLGRAECQETAATAPVMDGQPAPVMDGQPAPR